MQINKNSLMRLAHALKKTGLSLSAALKRAWYVVRLRARMLRGWVHFAYVKDDRSVRPAVGTLNGDAPLLTDLVVRYFDHTAGAIRSFRVDRLILD